AKGRSKEYLVDAGRKATHFRPILLLTDNFFLRGLLNIDDKMCGRHSLESRPSLLHQRFVRHLQRLDPKALVRNGTLKALMRDLASGVLPKSVTHRNDKMGFTTPIGAFVNHSAHLVREQISSSPFSNFY